jgi:hypothetical protein
MQETSALHNLILAKFNSASFLENSELQTANLPGLDIDNPRQQKI